MKPRQYISDYFRRAGVTPHDLSDEVRLLDQERFDRAVRARRVLSWCLREVFPGLSYPDIVMLLGWSSHSGPMKAVRDIDAEVFGPGLPYTRRPGGFRLQHRGAAA